MPMVFPRHQTTWQVRLGAFGMNVMSSRLPTSATSSVIIRAPACEKSKTSHS
jgi:hypothetical protein